MDFSNKTCMNDLTLNIIFMDFIILILKFKNNYYWSYTDNEVVKGGSNQAEKSFVCQSMVFTI